MVQILGRLDHVVIEARVVAAPSQAGLDVQDRDRAAPIQQELGDVSCADTEAEIRTDVADQVDAERTGVARNRTELGRRSRRIRVVARVHAICLDLIDPSRPGWRTSLIINWCMNRVRVSPESGLGSKAPHHMLGEHMPHHGLQAFRHRQSAQRFLVRRVIE